MNCRVLLPNLKLHRQTMTAAALLIFVFTKTFSLLKVLIEICNKAIASYLINLSWLYPCTKDGKTYKKHVWVILTHSAVLVLRKLRFLEKFLKKIFTAFSYQNTINVSSYEPSYQPVYIKQDYKSKENNFLFLLQEKNFHCEVSEKNCYRAMKLENWKIIFLK